jgi:mannose-1-phosphate guanylyltransferase/mannose-6-phosphate isomerase
MADLPIIPVILSGGSGTRLWPMSRTMEPKQLLAMLDNRTMLQATMDRLDGIGIDSDAIVVCAAGHEALVADQVPPATTLIMEPEGRNTAPAVAAAALAAEAHGGAILIVLPADHVVNDTAALAAAIDTAIPAAAAGQLVTFGVVPHYPETGYGYIHAADEVRPGVRRVAAFVEKPPRDVAEQYVAGGDHLWNSGMFVFRSDRYLEELDTHAPEIVAAVRTALDSATGPATARTLDAEAFGACPSDSVDFAVMEHTADAVVVPLDAGWNDVGSWSALCSLTDRDDAGNALIGDVIAIETTNSYVRAETRLVTTAGVDGLVVVETADAVLVVPKADAQRVKDIVAELKTGGRRESHAHPHRVTSWGRTTTLEDEPRHEVRRIEVAPAAEIVLQSTQDRAETWTVIAGTASTSHAGDVGAGSSFEAPHGEPWRITNAGTVALVMVVVSVAQAAG